jgi:hypothetical protein
MNDENNPLNIVNIVRNKMDADRAKQLQDSDQFVFGELIAKLEAVQNRALPILFDNGKIPSCLGSWRGVYNELYIGFDGDTNYYDGDEVQYVGEYSTDYNQIPSNLPENPTVQDMLDLCKRGFGRTFVGYKGGNYKMGKLTPVWVSKYGTTAGFDYDDPEIYETQVVGLTETPEAVIINTRGENYI